MLPSVECSREYVSEKGLMEIFHPTLISSCVVEDSLLKFDRHLDTIMQTSLDAALIAHPQMLLAILPQV